MPENFRRITLFILLLLFSAACFAQVVPSEPKPPGYFKEQRKHKNWWDEPTAVASLNLEEKQIAALIDLQKEFKKAFKENAATRKEQEKLLGQAILAGDDEKVSSLKKAMVELASADTAMQVELKIAGLAVLNKQQLAEIAARYPDVLDKSWGLRTKGMTRPKETGKQGASLKKKDQLEQQEEQPDKT